MPSSMTVFTRLELLTSAKSTSPHNDAVTSAQCSKLVGKNQCPIDLQCFYTARHSLIPSDITGRYCTHRVSSSHSDSLVSKGRKVVLKLEDN